MITENDIIQSLSELRSARQNIKKDLGRCPEGSLSISDSHDELIFRRVQYLNGKRVLRGIGRNETLIYELAHKEFLEKKLQAIDADIKLLESVLKKYRSPEFSSIMAMLPVNYRKLNPEYIQTPMLMGKESFKPHPSRDKSVQPRRLTESIGQLSPLEWGMLTYCENTFHAENKRIVSVCGLSVRSKSELAICSMYLSKGVFFHYDELLYIGTDKISPDFYCVRNDGTLFIHEHCGLDFPEYRKRMEYKLRCYASAGFEQGRNLLLTFDRPDGSINLDLISRMIDDMAACTNK